MFDLIDQRVGGVEQAGDPGHPQDPDLDIVHKVDDSRGDLDAFGAQRLQHLGQQRFNVVMHVERLQN